MLSGGTEMVTHRGILWNLFRDKSAAGGQRLHCGAWTEVIGGCRDKSSMPIQCGADTVNDAREELGSLLLFWLLSPSHISCRKPDCKRQSCWWPWNLWLCCLCALVWSSLTLEGTLAQNKGTVSVACICSCCSLCFSADLVRRNYANWIEGQIGSQN